MNRFSGLINYSLRPALLAVLVLPILAIIGCGDVSPAIGKYYTGRTLHLSVVAMEREPELVYTLPQAGEAPKYYRIAPEEADQELLLLRVKVENHKATSAIVDIDQGAAEVRDFFHDKYFPIDVKERPQEIDAPENISGQRIARCPPLHPTELCFLWNIQNPATEQALDAQLVTLETQKANLEAAIEAESNEEEKDTLKRALNCLPPPPNEFGDSVRAHTLNNGCGIDGWLIFEVPKEGEIRELRWRAGDGLTIEF